MNLNNVIDLLNQDLVNEYTHMMFYTVHSSTLLGPYRQVFAEFFKNHAKSEMVHAIEFQNLIAGLGGVPSPAINPVPVFAKTDVALDHAINMEQEVVDNYVRQLYNIEESTDSSFNSSDKLRVKLFLEKQFEDSRRDLEELKNLVSFF